MKRQVIMAMAVIVVTSLSGCNKAKTVDLVSTKIVMSTERDVKETEATVSEETSQAIESELDKSKETEVETVTEKVAEESLSKKPVPKFEISDDFKENFNKFTIDGVVVEVPSSYADMENYGFVLIEDSLRDYPAGSPADNHTQFGWKTKSNGSFKVVYTINDGKIVLPMHECTTKAFVVEAKNIGDTDIEFYGGINIDSTEDEVAAILDKQLSDHQKTVYKTCFDKSERSYIRVEFREGKISMIEIWNNVAESNEKYRY